MKTPPTNSICSVDPIVAQVIELPSHLPICQMLWPTDERTEKETFANAEFIADAFTVFHETGLTPREILDQRDEAIAIARTAIAGVEMIYGHAQFCDECKSFEMTQECRNETHGFDRINAIQNTTTKGDTPA